MTNNDVDQLYDWPTVIQLIQIYGGCADAWGCVDVWGCTDI